MPGSGSNLLHCPSGSQYQVTLGNLANLSCANWTTQTNKVLQAPLFFLDSDFGGGNIGGMALVARLRTSP